MTRRLAVFDCDGTLVDGQGSICTAMDRAFAACGLPLPDRTQVRRYVGLSLPIAMHHLLPDADEHLHRDLTEQYKTAYRAARAAGELAEPLYPGIAELIETLHGVGWLLGVATGKSDRGLSHVLASHGLTRFFTTLQTADRHPSKPHPAMLEAALAEALAGPLDSVMIGDTAYDMTMARAAGVRAIGVDWGYHPPEELRAAGAEAVASSAAQLGELLR
jgi:phosphoglycolate phosphatase